LCNCMWCHHQHYVLWCVAFTSILLCDMFYHYQYYAVW
jgi:hypothetical protein